MKRNEIARIAQAGACNPVPLARGLAEAIQEVRDAGGDPRQDAACRLIVHQMAHLFGLHEIDNEPGVYSLLMNEVEEI